MLKSFTVSYADLSDHLFPNYYRFKKKIDEYSARKDIISFALGDKDVLETLTDGEHAGQTFLPEGALFIKNSSVKRYSISEYDGFYISHKKNNTLTRSKLELHDVLFTTIGKYLGVSSVVNQNVVGANINQNVVRIKINPNFTTPQYLSCFLNSKIARFQIDSLFTGNTHPILTYPKIKSIKIFIKNKKIEKQISNNILESERLNLESLRLIDEAKQKLLNTLSIDFNKISKTRFFSVEQQQFTDNDIVTPEFYNPLYVNTIKEIKRKNKWVLLGDVADFKPGNEVGSRNYKLYSERQESDIPFIRTTDVFNFEIDRYPDFYVDEGIYQARNQGIQTNEILFTKDGKIGLTALITESDRCILGSGILRILPRKEIDPFYLFVALSIKEIGKYQAKQRTVIASTLPHLRADKIADFVIPRVKNENEISELAKKAFEMKEASKKLIDSGRLLLENSVEWT